MASIWKEWEGEYEDFYIMHQPWLDKRNTDNAQGHVSSKPNGALRKFSVVLVLAPLTIKLMNGNGTSWAHVWSIKVAMEMQNFIALSK